MQWWLVRMFARAKLFARGFEQGHVKLAAMDAQLGIFVTGEFSARLTIDKLPVAIEENAFAVFDGDLPQPVLEAERAKFAHGVREQSDPDSEGFDFRCAFVNLARKASPMEVHGEGEAGDAAADDDDLHSRLLYDGRARCSQNGRQ